MNKNFKISFQNYKLLVMTKIRKVLETLGRDAFSLILIFIILEIIFGEFLFYKHVLSIEINEPSVSSVSTEFQNKVYESVLKELQSRENISKESVQENYSSPFK